MLFAAKLRHVFSLQVLRNALGHRRTRVVQKRCPGRSSTRACRARAILLLRSDGRTLSGVALRLIGRRMLRCTLGASARTSGLHFEHFWQSRQLLKSLSA